MPNRLAVSTGASAARLVIPHALIHDGAANGGGPDVVAVEQHDEERQDQQLEVKRADLPLVDEARNVDGAFSHQSCSFPPPASEASGGEGGERSEPGGGSLFISSAGFAENKGPPPLTPSRHSLREWGEGNPEACACSDTSPASSGSGESAMNVRAFASGGSSNGIHSSSHSRHMAPSRILVTGLTPAVRATISTRRSPA
jgi:hypothetical protein